MWEVPDILQDKLQCIYCKGILSAPVYSISNNFICGLCAKDSNVSKRTREAGLEMLLPYLLYGCKNESSGCLEKLSSSEYENHTMACEFSKQRLLRNTSFESSEDDLLLTPPSSPSWSVTSNTFEYINMRTPKDLKAHLSCALKRNRTTNKPTILNIRMEIEPINRKQLCVLNNEVNNTISSNYTKPINIKVKAGVALSKNPEVVFCYLETYQNKPPAEEVIYSKICHSCNGSYEGEDFNCYYNHTLCRDCKNKKSCHTCTEQIRKTSMVKCSNLCPWMGRSYELSEHLKECQNVNIPCYFCDWRSPEKLLPQHYIQNHPERTVAGNSITCEFQNTDKAWAILISNKIYVCKYFKYDEFIEIMVEQYSNGVAPFTFEVCILSEINHQLKTRIRSGANFKQSVLEEGVKYHFKSLNKLKINLCDLNFKLTIFC